MHTAHSELADNAQFIKAEIKPLFFPFHTAEVTNDTLPLLQA